MKVIENISKDQDILVFFRYHAFLARAMAVFFASVILLIIGVYPAVQKFSGVRDKLKKEEDVLKKLTGQVLVLDNLDDNILKQKIEVLDRVLPLSKDVVAYLNTLDGLSRELGLSMGDISLAPGEIYSSRKEDEASEKKRNSGLSSLETEVRITGDIAKIYDFLKQIENIAPLMLIKDVQMSRVGTFSETFVLTVRLGMIYADPVTSGSFKGVVNVFSSEDEKIFNKISEFKYYSSNMIPVDDNSNSGSENRDLFAPGFSERTILLDQSNLPQPQQDQELNPFQESSQSAQDL